MGPTTIPHQISLNFKIVCHLDSVPKFAENADAINVLQLLQAKYTRLILQTLARRIEQVCMASSLCWQCQNTQPKYHLLWFYCTKLIAYIKIS